MLDENAHESDGFDSDDEGFLSDKGYKPVSD